MEAERMLKHAEMLVDVRRCTAILSRELENKVNMNNPDVSVVVRTYQFQVQKELQDAVFSLQKVKDQIKQNKND